MTTPPESDSVEAARPWRLVNRGADESEWRYEDSGASGVAWCDNGLEGFIRAETETAVVERERTMHRSEVDDGSYCHSGEERWTCGMCRALYLTRLCTVEFRRGEEAERTRHEMPCRDCGGLTTHTDRCTIGGTRVWSQLVAAEAALEAMRAEFVSYVEEKTWAYGIGFTYEHDCSLDDACPIAETATRAALAQTTDGTPGGEA